MLKRLALLLLVAFVFGVPAWGQAPAAPSNLAINGQPAAAGNPLLEPWTTPFQVPPYDKIKPEHFLPAFKVAIEQNRKEVDAIVNNPQPPTFANTIDALEFSGELLSRVQGAFGGLQSADTTPALQAVNREVTPLLSAMRDDIRLNDKLFQRIKTVYEKRASATLTPLQVKMVDEWDNQKIVSRIASLRVERAQLLGDKTHADFVLEENMAKTPAGVYGLLNQLWTPARAVALKEEEVPYAARAGRVGRRDDGLQGVPRPGRQRRAAAEGERLDIAPQGSERFFSITVSKRQNCHRENRSDP